MYGGRFRVFLDYFSVISRKFLSYFPFLNYFLDYFPLISHFSIVFPIISHISQLFSRLFPKLLLTSQLFLDYFSVISCLDYFSMFSQLDFHDFNTYRVIKWLWQITQRFISFRAVILYTKQAVRRPTFSAEDQSVSILA